MTDKIDAKIAKEEAKKQAEQIKLDAKIAKEEAKKKAEQDREDKIDEIIDVYAHLADQNLRVTMNDMIDAGYTKDTITYYFRSLGKLNIEARMAYPKRFRDIYIDDLIGPETLARLHNKVEEFDRFIVTTAVTGCQICPQMLASMKLYCKMNNAHILVLIASDPAHNKFAPGTNYGTIDKRLVNDPDVTIVTGDIALNTNICISTVKLSAKHTDPATSMSRIASKKGSFIFASPKQRLKAVAVSNSKMPHFTMTTGAITESDYSSTNYMSGRISFIAENDHVMGGLVIEVEDEDIYHFRQFQSDDDGMIVDLGVGYCEDGTTKDMESTLVMGDWHSGSTDPGAKKSWFEVAKECNVSQGVIHDGFDGASINHHERMNTISRAKNVKLNMHDLGNELITYASDLKELSDVFEKLVLVKSNHDEFLERYLQTGYYVKDPQNHRLALDLAADYMDGLNPLRVGVERAGLKTYSQMEWTKVLNKIRWLDRDEDFKIKGIQLGAHGDLGTNGSRGSVKSMESAYGLSVSGHSHTPEILRGAYQVGTSSLLKLSYNRGPSSWMHTSCLVYSNGSRQLINSINGSWRL